MAKYNHSQRCAASAVVKSAATVILVHAYHSNLDIVSRTAGQVAYEQSGAHLIDHLLHGSVCRCLLAACDQSC